MKNTQIPNAAQPSADAIYEFTGRRFVVNATFPDNIGSPLSELLLRIMVNDGNHPFGTHDKPSASV